ncbi:MAG: thiamine pyrophosphate-binding protein [Myxococcaceae bacterium]|nr:thiamine pyrophosphate-binding protein [Myxococcaceae bacterium]
MARKSGGAVIGDVLRERGVRFLFTLCGGHISPILVEAKARGIRVVGMRDEKNAVFAADAVARMTGVPGVAAVTAGPGVTNTVTAVKNAQMAQSPLVLFGGATATILRGRGSLQDIDQLSLMKPLTKWATRVTTHASLRPTVERAFEVAKSGVPGPVFVEVPIDLLYDEKTVRDWYLRDAGVKDADNLGARLLKLYLEGHLYRQFNAPHLPVELPRRELKVPSLAEVAARFPPPVKSASAQVKAVGRLVANAKRPVLVLGSQALVNCTDPEKVADAVRKLGIPTFLGGTARGLLGRRNPLQFRHHRSKALKEADLVIIAGFPFDFRLGYGRTIGRKATLVSVNLSTLDLRKNRRPDVAVKAHPGEFLVQLASVASSPRNEEWFDKLTAREKERDEEIAKQAAGSTSDLIDPIHFFLRLEEKMADDAVLVVDGGDFVATGSYVVRPRAPLSWLDPGVFGTLGVGGGFATGAALVYPGREVWLLYGDGSSAYSLAEFDTWARHQLAPIAVVGNDGSWAQIARDQVEILGDDVGTVLARTAYERVAEGYGGKGLRIDKPSEIDAVLDEAKAIAKSGKPVCVNVMISKSDFRKGSISM